MNKVVILFQFEDGTRHVATFNMKGTISQVSHAVDDMLRQASKIGKTVSSYTYAIHDLIGIKEDILEKLCTEYNELEKGWLSLKPKELIKEAKRIATIQAAKEYIELVVSDGKSQLHAYTQVESILEGFYTFHCDGMDNTVNERVVIEFENYLLSKVAA